MRRVLVKVGGRWEGGWDVEGSRHVATFSNRPFGESRVFPMANKTFTYEYPDTSPRSLSYECSETELLNTSVENGVPFLYANRAGMLTLAKILIKLSQGACENGFHLHLRRNFGDDAATPDVLTILLDESSDR